MVSVNPLAASVLRLNWYSSSVTMLCANHYITTP